MSARPWAVALLLAACAPAGDAPARVAWDRDTCRACGMALSDRHAAAQVRGGPRGATEKFDDLGCAVTWLAKQPWAEEPATRVWVARSTDGAWLEARQAHFVEGAHTPMGYGWAAVDATQAGLDFTTLRSRLAGTTR